MPPCVLEQWSSEFKVDLRISVSANGRNVGKLLLSLRGINTLNDA
jgi:hypothetical protein